MGHREGSQSLAGVATRRHRTVACLPCDSSDDAGRQVLLVMRPLPADVFRAEDCRRSTVHNPMPYLHAEIVRHPWGHP